MISSRIVHAFVWAGASAAMARGQAALEYAARSAGSAMANGPGDFYLGACPIDNSVLRCVHQFYPTLFNVSLVGVFLFICFLLVPKNKY